MTTDTSLHINSTPGTYITRPEFITAVQFQGWSNAQQIALDFCSAFYIPQGYDSKDFRFFLEYEDDKTTVRADAPAFLLAYAEKDFVRVDEGDYLVKFTNPEQEYIDAVIPLGDFEAKYSRKIS